MIGIREGSLRLFTYTLETIGLIPGEKFPVFCFAYFSNVLNYTLLFLGDDDNNWNTGIDVDVNFFLEVHITEGLGFE
jgi:hypothetical protein